MKNHVKKLISALLLCSLVSVFIFVPSSTSALTIDEIEEKQAELQTEKDALEETLNELQDDQDNLEAYQAALQAKILFLEESIDTSAEHVVELDASILELTENIAQAALEYEDSIELLKERIVALYTSGTTSTLQILLNSTSLFDFSLRTTAMEAISEHDQALIDEIEEYAELTKSDRELLVEEQDQIAEIKKQQEADTIELAELYAESLTLTAELSDAEEIINSSLEDLSVEDAEYDQMILDLIEEQERLEAEAAAKAEEEAASSSSSSSSSSGTANDTGNELTSGSVELVDGFADPVWPVPGYVGYPWETCDYGWTTDGYYHYGFDIAAPSGTPIVAAQSGEVIAAFYSSSWGNNVLIYHNSTYSTRYAHMSTMAVSVGDYVYAGQVIGYVGSTGNSSGPHLHFELYENGVRIDPEPFLKS